MGFILLSGLAKLVFHRAHWLSSRVGNHNHFDYHYDYHDDDDVHYDDDDDDDVTLQSIGLPPRWVIIMIEFLLTDGH